MPRLACLPQIFAGTGQAQAPLPDSLPDSAHGTNPATAALIGFRPAQCRPARRHVGAEAVRAALAPDVAAIMLTNPNTCGLFERNIVEIAEAVHAAGAYFYRDGANFNAVMGKARPGDLGVDAMHINLHKTFSTPHGGGGPGAGPVVLSARLAPYARRRRHRRTRPALSLVDMAGNASVRPHVRLPRPDGHVRARARLILSHGGDGRQASEDAVLSANYMRASLDDVMSAPFGDRPCMHEALFDDRWLKDTGLTTLDFAKAMIDEGYHPMTVYFPLVVHGAMLIEPTESESKASLDLFIMTLRDLAFARRRANASASSLRRSPRRDGGSTRRERRASRHCAGRSRRQPEGRDDGPLGAARA